MTNQEREDAIRAQLEFMKLATTREERVRHWETARWLINGRSKERVREMEKEKFGRTFD